MQNQVMDKQRKISGCIKNEYCVRYFQYIVNGNNFMNLWETKYLTHVRTLHFSQNKKLMKTKLKGYRIFRI